MAGTREYEPLAKEKEYECESSHEAKSDTHPARCQRSSSYFKVPMLAIETPIRAMLMRRLMLTSSVGMSAADMESDGVSMSVMASEKHEVAMAAALAASIIAPQLMTWAFLYHNKMATLLGLSRVVIGPALGATLVGLLICTGSRSAWQMTLACILCSTSLEPFYQLTKSWPSGKESAELIWTTIAEGTMEAPIGAIITLYALFVQMVNRPGEGSWIFGVSASLGCFSAARASTKLYFYGQDEAPRYYFVLIILKLPGVISQILTFSMFAYITRLHGHGHLVNCPVGLVFLMAELALNYGLLSVVSNKLPVAVALIFSCAMCVGGPPGFLPSLARARKSHALQHAVLQCVMVSIAIAGHDERARALHSSIPGITVVWALSVPVAFLAAFCDPEARWQARGYQVDVAENMFVHAVESSDAIVARLLVDVEEVDPTRASPKFWQRCLSFIDVPHTGESRMKWSGAVAFDDKLFFCPHNAKDIMVLDTGTMTPSFIGTGKDKGGRKWSGAVAFEDKVFFCPYNASDILVLDTGTMTPSFIGTGKGEGGEKWRGVVAFKDKVFFCPYNASDILVLDTGTMTPSFISTGKGEGRGKWSGAAALKDKLFFCPRNASDILALDTGTMTPSFIDTGTVEGGLKWNGVVALKDKLFFCPCDAGDILVLDTGTMTPSFIGTGKGEGGRRWWGAVALEDKLFLCPHNATDILVLDMETMTPNFICTGKGEGMGKWWGAAALEDKLFFCPYNANDIMVLDTGIMALIQKFLVDAELDVSPESA